tara:strand:- start:8795 stop:9823 length:1029 start_codon:yes stop_codon:yes gene_type:complete
MVRIIAECAQGYLADNIDESINLAKWLVKSAKYSGADAVKFQLILADELCTPDYKYYALSKKLELGFEGWQSICDLSKNIEIELIFDIFGLQSFQMAEMLEVKEVKLHPTDFRNKILLNAVANSSQITSVIAGCGGSLYEEIKNTLMTLGNNKLITLLHGFQGYPTPLDQNCLDRIKILNKLCEEYGSNIQIGFADHASPISSESTHLAAMAVGLGVKVLEKHITLAKCLKLEDYESALSPDEFQNFVNIIKNINSSRGNAKQSSSLFDLPPSENKYREFCIRHVVTRKDLKIGQVIRESDICLKRSSSKEPITEIKDVIGKKLIKNKSANQFLVQSDFNHE